MPDEVHVDEERGIIKVESYGIVSTEDIENSIGKVREILTERGLNKILVDTTRQETVPGTAALFDLFSTFPRNLKAALLSRESQITVEDLRFVENVSVNRGIFVRVFHTEDEALGWLSI